MAITHPSFGTLADDRIIIFDTTLRDGEQSPGFSMNLEEKLRMAEALWELGVDVMEAGFPIASPATSRACCRSRSISPRTGRWSVASRAPRPPTSCARRKR